MKQSFVFSLIVIGVVALQQPAQAQWSGVVEYIHDLWATACLLRTFDCKCHLITELQSFQVVNDYLRNNNLIDFSSGDINVIFPQLMQHIERPMFAFCGYSHDCARQFFDAGMDYADFGLSGANEQAVRGLAPLVCSKSSLTVGVEGYCLMELADVVTKLWEYPTPEEIVRNASQYMARLCLGNCMSKFNSYRHHFKTLLLNFAPEIYDNVAVKALFDSSKGFNALCSKWEGCVFNRRVEEFTSRALVKGQVAQYQNTLATKGCMNGDWPWPNDCGASNYDPKMFYYPKLVSLNDYCRRCTNSGCDAKESNTRPTCSRIAPVSETPICPTPNPTKNPTQSPVTQSPTLSPTYSTYAGAFMNDLSALEGCESVESSLLVSFASGVYTGFDVGQSDSRATIALRKLFELSVMQKLCALPTSCKAAIVTSGIQWDTLAQELSWTGERKSQIAGIVQNLDVYCAVQDIGESGELCLNEYVELTNTWKDSCYVGKVCASCLEPDSCNAMSAEAGCAWDAFDALCEARNANPARRLESGDQLQSSFVKSNTQSTFANSGITKSSLNNFNTKTQQDYDVEEPILSQRLLQNDLPILPSKLSDVIDNCDFDALIAVGDQISAASDDETFQVIVDSLNVLCQKPLCVPTLVDALDYSQLPAFNTPEFIAALKFSKNKFCLKNNGGLCYPQLMASLDGATSRPISFCSTGCFTLLGGKPFLDGVIPVMETISPMGSLGSKVCEAEPTAAPTSSPVRAPTFPPKPEQADEFCSSSCPATFGNFDETQDQALLVLIEEISTSTISIVESDLPSNICVAKAPTASPTEAPTATYVPPTTSPSQSPTKSPITLNMPQEAAEFFDVGKLVKVIATANNIPADGGMNEILGKSACDWEAIASGLGAIDTSQLRERYEILSDLFFTQEAIDAICKGGDECANQLFQSLHTKYQELPQLPPDMHSEVPTVLSEFGSKYLCKLGGTGTVTGTPTRRLAEEGSDSAVSCFETYAGLLHAVDQENTAKSDGARLLTGNVENQLKNLYRRLNEAYTSEGLLKVDPNRQRNLQSVIDVIDIASLISSSCSLPDIINLGNVLQEQPAGSDVDGTLALVLNALSSSVVGRQLCQPDLYQNDPEKQFTPDCPLELINAVNSTYLPVPLQQGPMREILERFAKDLCLVTTETGALCSSQAFAGAATAILFSDGSLPISPYCRNGCSSRISKKDEEDILTLVNSLKDPSDSTDESPNTICPFSAATSSETCMELSNEASCGGMDSYLQSNPKQGRILLAAILGRDVNAAQDENQVNAAEGFSCGALTKKLGSDDDLWLAVGVGSGAGLVVLGAAFLVLKRYKSSKGFEDVDGSNIVVGESVPAKRFFLNPKFSEAEEGPNV